MRKLKRNYYSLSLADLVGMARLQALLQRGIRSGLCSPETPNLTELTESVDDILFQRIVHNPYHVLYHLLPERRELVYRLLLSDQDITIGN